MEFELDLDLIVREVSVQIGGKPYVLREASEESHKNYQNALVSGARVQNNTIVGIANVADAESVLLSGCLFAIEGDQSIPVPLVVIRSWPQRVVRPLIDKLKKISEIDQEGEAAKNERDDTLSGSS